MNVMPYGSANANYPYPSSSQLRAEARVDELMGEHEAASKKLKEALVACRATISLIEFPCGSPVTGYDIEDILTTLDDMMPSSLSDDDARERAWDKAYGEQCE